MRFTCLSCGVELEDDRPECSACIQAQNRFWCFTNWNGNTPILSYQEIRDAIDLEREEV